MGCGRMNGGRLSRTPPLSRFTVGSENSRVVMKSGKSQRLQGLIQGGPVSAHLEEASEVDVRDLVFTIIDHGENRRR